MRVRMNSAESIVRRLRRLCEVQFVFDLGIKRRFTKITSFVNPQFTVQCAQRTLFLSYPLNMLINKMYYHQHYNIDRFGG